MGETHAEGPAEGAETAGRTVVGLRTPFVRTTAWALLAGPTTAVALGALLALQLFGAAFVPDELAAADLARSTGFGRAEVLRGLGLVDPTGSWLFWLLVLLLALHVVARGLSGPASTHGDNAPVTDRGRGGLVAVTLTGLGLVALLAGLIEGRRLGLDAELTVRLDGAAEALGEVTVGPGLRVKRTLPLSLACAAPDPRDVAFILGCTLTTAGGASTIQLVPGEVTTVDDLALSLREARVAASTAVAGGGGAQRAGFLWWQAGTPQRLVLTPGTPVRAASDATRTFEAGLNPATPAPWLRVAGGRPDVSSGMTLLWPDGARAARTDGAGGAGAARTEGETRFEALLPQEVTLRVVQRPWAARALLGLGFALAAAGLLLAAARDRRPAEETA